jgi:hypothetical protein
MVQVYFGTGMTVCQLEGFPADCPRSCEGAIYARPGTMADMTDGELAHMKAAYPHLMPHVRSMPVAPKQLAPAPKSEEPALFVAVPADPEPEAEQPPAAEAEPVEDMPRRGRRKSP